MVCPKTRPPLLQNNGSIFRNNLVQSDTASKAFSFDRGWDPAGFYGILADPELKDSALNNVNQNQLLIASTEFKLAGMYNTNAPDLSPLANSPALTGAKFNDADLATFFTAVSFKGAVGPTNWAASSNWAVWK
jgi:hypothetical protein